ncbi:uncharacterized protein [Spinacia oleracea]|uniref:MULE transposase domain-containing protein n=1 Tax=Spinacia oleracea TaxID=3562 RepID=A0ABM3RQI5_SPIOL|nr:uncharacterized protein LOC130471655 [Spinacia oleracea]
MVGGTWKLLVNDGNHNHDFPAYNVGHSIISRLTNDEKNKTKKMTRAHVTPSQILVSIKNESKENLTTVKQIYNFRHKIRNEEMDGRSVMQQTLKYLNDESYFYWYRAHQLDVFRLEKNFVAGFAFLQDEKKDSFEWALRCVRALFDPDHMPEVIVTDREYALIHAIDDVFSKSQHMLCIRHIVKNVEARVKLDTRSALFASGFLRQKLSMKQTVESSHNALKRFLKTSTGSLDTIWKRLYSLLELQENEIQANFVRFENIDLHIIVLHLLSQLKGADGNCGYRSMAHQIYGSEDQWRRIQIGTMTYFPLYVPEGFTTTEKLIGVAFLRSCVHFVSVSLVNECPVPEFWGAWFNFHDGTVQGWDAPFYPRIDRWKLLRG